MRLGRVLLALSLVGIARGEVLQRPLSLAEEHIPALQLEGLLHGQVGDVRPKENTWTAEDPAAFHKAYHPLFEIEEFMRSLSTSYPALVSREVVGTSAEGRKIFALRIANDTEPEEGKERRRKEKDVLIVSGAQHAREWIAIASALYLAETLVTSSSPSMIHSVPPRKEDVRLQETKLTKLLETYDVHIIPVPNPDGYVYTWEEDRMWYKNRQDVSRDGNGGEDGVDDEGEGDECVGLDMNRNWGFAWAPETFQTSNSTHTVSIASFASLSDITAKKKPGKKQEKKKHPSPSPSEPQPDPKVDRCSHWYPGSSPFEAPETRALAAYVQRLSHPNQEKQVEVFVDLRSYGQMLSFPYSYSCDTLPADAENLYEAALGAAFDVRKLHGTIYTTGSLCANLYPAPGNIIDWMYGVAGVKFAYALHLGDTGTYGYTLPSAWIRPIGSETVTIVTAIGDFAAHLRK